MDDLRQDHGVDRCNLAGLEHHGTTGGQRRRNFQSDLVQREIPGRDATDHAYGFAHHE